MGKMMSGYSCLAEPKNSCGVRLGKTYILTMWNSNWVQFHIRYVLVRLTRAVEKDSLLARIDDESEDRDVFRKARSSLGIETLPMNQRPAVYHLVDADLQDKDFQDYSQGVKISRGYVLQDRKEERADNISDQITLAIALVAELNGQDRFNGRLRDDLAFDSLMAVELSAALGSTRQIEAKRARSCGNRCRNN